MPRYFSCLIVVLFLLISLLAHYPCLWENSGHLLGCAIAGEPSQGNRGVPGLSDREVETLHSFFDAYYRNPQPDKVVEVVQILAKADALRSDKGPKWGLVCFFAEVFKQNENMLMDWETSFRTLPDNMRLNIAYALWWSKTKTGANILEAWSMDESNKSMVKEVRGAPIPDLDKIKIQSRADLNMLWSAFPATGDTKFVDRIVLFLADEKKMAIKDMEQDQRKRARGRPFIFESAIASLIENAIQHELVYERLQFYADDSPDPDIRSLTAFILKRVDKRKAAQGN